MTTKSLAADIRLQSVENHVALIGHFYVLGGSSQGARQLLTSRVP
jgi:hypothetical protein